MKILLVGHGRMGRLIESLARDAGHSVEKAIDIENIQELSQIGRVADIAIDFSSPAVLPMLSDCIRRTGMALLSGTTGYTAEDLGQFQALGAFAPVLHSANYSIGVAVFRRVLAQISPTLLDNFDVEITEAHHNKKADAPSGTAKLLYEAIDPQHAYTPVYGREGFCGQRNPKEIGIHALRGGTVAGMHTVSFFGQDEEFSITHRAASRVIFANGALRAATALVCKDKGCYTLDELLFGGNA
ncbi:MAG: 4-hydroxy-tetrahydrodipicolinate reductase [Candidatus Pelethousia sp.]|nr:4-hydroxy-tetrahydrodipicolinate reductase [Candidatus Pelethousia sp.]